MADIGDRGMIPARVWSRPDMRRALAAHDLQAVFRLMQRHGVAQRTIAAATGLAQSDVSDIARGRRRVHSYPVLVRLADGLRLPRGWLGLAYDQETAALLQGPSAAAMGGRRPNRRSWAASTTPTGWAATGPPR